MTNMAEDLKTTHLRDAAPLPNGAATAEDRRRTDRKRSPREQKKRTANIVIYGVLVVLVVALMG